MQTVIGLAGKKSAGKGTVARILCKILGFDVEHFRSSDILTATLDLWDIEHTRDNYGALPVAMEYAYGKGILTRVMRKKIMASSRPYVIFDGVRWETDVRMIRKFPQNMIWYVTAPLELNHFALKREDSCKRTKVLFHSVDVILKSSSFVVSSC